MPVIAKYADGTLTIKVIGFLDKTVQKSFENSYQDFAMPVKEFVLDFEQTDNIDSAGIGLLMMLHRSATSQTPPIALSIINCSSGLRMPLKISRVSRLYKIIG